MALLFCLSKSGFVKYEICEMYHSSGLFKGEFKGARPSQNISHPSHAF